MAKQHDSASADQKQWKYPYYPYRNSLRLAEVVKGYANTTSECPKAVVAERLAMSEKSSSLFQLLCTAKCFGMISGNKAYRLTDLSIRYFMPDSPDEQRLAELDFLAAPAAFSHLLDRFDGSELPNANTVSNVLIREVKVPKSWGPRAASLFLSTVNELRVVDDRGYLRYKAAKHQPSQGAQVMKEPAEPPSIYDMFKVQQPPRQEPRPAGRDIIVAGVRPDDPRLTQQVPSNLTACSTVTWVRPFGADQIRVETPEEMTAAQWEALERYIQSLKPVQ